MSTISQKNTNIETDSRDSIAAERKARRFWVGFILLLFAINLGMTFFGVYLASSNKSMAVVPDYYERSLHWDEVKAERAASSQLGWEVDVDIVGNMDSTGHRGIELKIEDAKGLPIIGATANLRLYHHARGNAIQQLKLSETEPGLYTGTAIMPMDGLWQYDLSVDQGETHFVWSHEQELSNYP